MYHVNFDNPSKYIKGLAQAHPKIKLLTHIIPNP